MGLIYNSVTAGAGGRRHLGLVEMGTSDSDRAAISLDELPGDGHQGATVDWRFAGTRGNEKDTHRRPHRPRRRLHRTPRRRRQKPRAAPWSSGLFWRSVRRCCTDLPEVHLCAPRVFKMLLGSFFPLAVDDHRRPRFHRVPDWQRPRKPRGHFL